MARPSGVIAPATPQAAATVLPGPTRWSLAELIEARPMAWALLLSGAMQAGLVSVGWPGWPCPVQTALGLPCPGCGLSRAVAALGRGDWRAAIEIHPFVFLALVFFAIVTVGALAPAPVASRLARALRAVEVRTRATFILATAFLVYGLIRLAVVAVPFVGRALR